MGIESYKESLLLKSGDKQQVPRLIQCVAFEENSPRATITLAV